VSKIVALCSALIGMSPTADTSSSAAMLALGSGVAAFLREETLCIINQ